MKELHNHIFSNTTCISKETMLKYINNQLSVKELHEVEKHMLDCELCSDALAGMKYAQNSSMLFAIDNEIDQRVRMGQNKAPLMRNLMVAASLLIIVFGSYFTFDFFNETVDSDANLAIKKEGVLEEKNTEVPLTESSTKEKSFAAESERSEMANGVTNEPGDKMQQQVLDVTTIVMEDAEMEEEIEEVPMSPEVNEITLSDDIQVVERDEMDASGNKNKNDQYGAALEQQNAPQPAGNISSTTTPNKDLDNLNKNNLGSAGNKRDKTKDTQKTRAKKGNSKRKASAPAFKQESEMLFAAEEKLEEAKAPRTTITLSDHKVVNYIDEYQREFDAKQIIETKSVDANFETEDRMAEAEKEKEEETIEITYKATLEKAMAYYNAQKYTMALTEFDVILKEHDDEVNALFYGGLSYYHLNKNNLALAKLDKVLVNKKTEFNQEARWYKALTLIELKQTDKAKKLLNQIVTENGFYKAKAEEKLKELK